MMHRIANTNDKTLFKPFLAVIIITLFIRIFFAIFIPFTGDEAYFAIWGINPSLGYYDHTPLVGWILYLLLFLGKSSVVMRLPSIILPALIAIGMYSVLRHYNERKAALVSILFLITPINIALVLISTDVPLIIFSFYSGVFLFLAIKYHDYLFYYVLSGIFLGLAFFSKYFAVLLALAYIVYFIASKKSWKRTLGFILLFLFVLPFGLENIYWNYTHDWANILFNVYNRNHDMALGWHNLVKYILIVFYLTTPPVFYYLCKRVKTLFARQADAPFNLIAFLFLVPLFFFLILSTIKSIGFHWSFSFVPFIYFGLFVYLESQEIIRSLKFMVWFSGIHIVILAILLALPLPAWQHFGFRGENYADLVYFFKHKNVQDALNSYHQQFIFSSHSYAQADMLFFDSGTLAPTFGFGSAHGREGDLMADFKAMAHKNFLILCNYKPDAKEFSFYASYFDHAQLKSFQLFGADFYFVLGYNFNYEKYRDTVLQKIYHSYWQVPHYLPYKLNFYCEKYFPEEGCKNQK